MLHWLINVMHQLPSIRTVVKRRRNGIQIAVVVVGVAAVVVKGQVSNASIKHHQENIRVRYLTIQTILDKEITIATIKVKIKTSENIRELR